MKQITCENEMLCAGKNVTELIVEFEKKSNLSVKWALSWKTKEYLFRCTEKGHFFYLSLKTIIKHFQTQLFTSQQALVMTMRVDGLNVRRQVGLFQLSIITGTIWNTKTFLVKHVL